MSDQDAHLRCRIDIHIIDADGELRHDAQILRRLQDFLRDGRAPNRSSHECIATRRHFRHLVFIISLGGVPVRLSQDELTTGILQHLVRVARWIGGSKDENFGFCH